MLSCRNLRAINFRCLLQNRLAKTTCLTASRAYIIQDKCNYLNTVQKKCVNFSCSNPVKECVRFKSRDKSKKSSIQEYESDSEDEEEEEEEGLAAGFDEQGHKLKRIKLNSIRLESVLTGVWGLTRRRLDELFARNCVHVNNIIGIKSHEIKINDVVEIRSLDCSSYLKNIREKKIEILKIEADFVSKTFNVQIALLE